MTNNVRFLISIGDTNMGNLQLVMIKTNRIGVDKYNI